jgi:hypothetical protein
LQMYSNLLLRTWRELVVCSKVLGLPDFVARRKHERTSLDYVQSVAIRAFVWHSSWKWRCGSGEGNFVILRFAKQ